LIRIAWSLPGLWCTGSGCVSFGYDSEGLKKIYIPLQHLYGTLMSVTARPSYPTNKNASMINNMAAMQVYMTGGVKVW
jgi:hypothetical protein